MHAHHPPAFELWSRWERQACRAITTATTSATLLEGMIEPDMQAYAEAPESENHAEPATQDSEPLRTAEPSVHTLTMEGVWGLGPESLKEGGGGEGVGLVDAATDDWIYWLWSL